MILIFGAGLFSLDRLFETRIAPAWKPGTRFKSSGGPVASQHVRNVGCMRRVGKENVFELLGRYATTNGQSEKVNGFFCRRTKQMGS